MPGALPGAVHRISRAGQRSRPRRAAGAQDRFQECIGCYICVEACTLLTDYDAIRMYDVDLVEQLVRERTSETR